MFDWTTYSNLTCLQNNVDTILISNRQFDLFFDATHSLSLYSFVKNKSVELPFVTKE